MLAVGTRTIGTLRQTSRLPRFAIFMSQAIVNSTWASVRFALRRQGSEPIFNFHHLRGLSTRPLRQYPIKSASVCPKQIAITLPAIQPISQYFPFKGLKIQTRRMSSVTPLPDRYKLVFFVPPSDLEACKEAIFATGAGSFPGGKYTKCCFQTNGTGQFLPSQDANPAIGSVGALERCEEVKAEIMCLGRDVMLNAVQALIKAHPYEEVAYEVYRMENV